MNLTGLLREMHEKGELSAGQLDRLTDLHSRRLYSLHRELRAALYAGVLLIAAGVALTVRRHFAELGDIAVIGALASGALGAFAYCFAKGRPYSSGAVEPPGVAFDYVLLFGCTCYATCVGYIENQFHVLGSLWIHYLLVSAALFFFLAYRFDNRLVLSMALSTLAAWFGLQLSDVFLSFHRYYRESAIAYGALSLALGFALHRLDIKRHFLDIYLNFAVHFLMAALLWGVAEFKAASWHLPAMGLAVAAVAAYSLHRRRFLYMLYAILYGFAGVSILALDVIDAPAGMYLYGIASSLAVLWLILTLSRRYREAP